MSLRCLGLLACLTACGYTVGARRIHTEDAKRVALSDIREAGVDIDAAAAVTVALKRAIAQSPGLRLSEDAEYLLDVELLDINTGLNNFAEPGLRAAGYRVRVTLRANMRGLDGRVLWESPAFTGETPFISVPGRVEALDGAGRRALERAAELAAERLVAAVMMKLR